MRIRGRNEWSMTSVKWEPEILQRGDGIWNAVNEE